MKRAVAMAGPVLFLIGVGILVYRVMQTWSDTSISEGFDFRLVYAAGHAMTTGHSLFAVQLLGHPYGYPPSSALVLGAPLSYFSWTTVTHILRPLQAACLVATVVIAARTVGRGWNSLAAGTGVLLVSLAGISSDGLSLENASIFVALLGAAAFLAWSQERYILCGLLFGFGIALKPLLLPLCIGLILLRRWNVLGTAALVVAVLNLVALGIDPKSLNGMGTFVRGLLTDSGAISGAFFLFNSAYVSMGVLFGWPSLVTVGLRVLVAIVTITGVFIVWKTRPEPARSLEAGGLLIAGFYLASSDLEAHWLLVLIPFAFASVVSGSPLRWWPVVLGAIFASQLVTLPQGLTQYGIYGIRTVDITWGLSLVVLATSVAALSLAMGWRIGPFTDRASPGRHALVGGRRRNVSGQSAPVLLATPEYPERPVANAAVPRGDPP